MFKIEILLILYILNNIKRKKKQTLKGMLKTLTSCAQKKMNVIFINALLELRTQIKKKQYLKL